MAYSRGSSYILYSFDAARRFTSLAQGLHGRGFDPHRVAHFLNRLLFCLFAEDCDLLPRQLFTRLLEGAAKSPRHGEALLQGLFGAMARGGAFGVEVVDWFNGGLFSDGDTLPRMGGSSGNCWRCRGWTGATSSRPSSVPCSSAAWTRPSAPSSGRTTPTANPSCAWSARSSGSRSWPSGSP
jgi:hypothetical protein